MAQIKPGAGQDAGAGGKGEASAAGVSAQAIEKVKAHGTQNADHGKLAAKAFTGGNTAHFQQGAGDKLASHEAAHAVQQRAGVQL